MQHLTVSQYYEDSALLDRVLVRLRPYICPFMSIIQWVPASSTVLDIGCGRGQWLLTLAASGRMVKGTGCDIDHHSLEIGKKAAEHYAQSGGTAQINFQYTATMDEWPKTQKFDVVSLIDVLHHVSPKMQPDYIRQALNLVKPGGILIYKDMASTPAWAAWGNRLHDLVMARQWIHYFSIEDVIEVIRQAGGSVKYRENIRRLFYLHEFLLVQI